MSSETHGRGCTCADCKVQGGRRLHVVGAVGAACSCGAMLAGLAASAAGAAGAGAAAGMAGMAATKAGPGVGSSAVGPVVAVLGQISLPLLLVSVATMLWGVWRSPGKWPKILVIAGSAMLLFDQWHMEWALLAAGLALVGGAYLLLWRHSAIA